MGIQDRDYYWKDKERREKKFERADLYYRPKEFRREQKVSPRSVKHSTPWADLQRRQWTVFWSFIAGSAVTFISTMVALHLAPNALWAPYEATRAALSAIGLLP